MRLQSMSLGEGWNFKLGINSKISSMICIFVNTAFKIKFDPYGYMFFVGFEL